MKLASHNTMSYLTPAKWYMRLFHFVGKCQDLNIIDQHNLGVRMFDLRITYENGIPKFAHGHMTFKTTSVEHYLSLINSWDDCYIRIVLETPKRNNSTNACHALLFKNDVERWINCYNNIKFIEGARKYDWKYLVNPNKLAKTPKYIQKISSMTGSIIDDWFPRLYAMFNNKKIIKMYVNDNKSDENEFVFVDFIGKYY
jgi:hypothetical protein